MTLRPATRSDKAFLFSLHRATMHEYIEQTWGWDDVWQRADFERRFPDHEILIIHADGRDAGAVWLRRSSNLTYIADLQILPELQGRGIGTWVLQGLIADATSIEIPLELCVLQVNPRARRLYERLGFVMTDDGYPLISLRYQAPTATPR